MKKRRDIIIRNDAIILLNKIFSECIINMCKGKKVLLTLSGGLDTRLICSVLERYHIVYDAYTFFTFNADVYYVKRLLKKLVYMDEWIFDGRDLSLCWEKDLDVRKQFSVYDVVLHGEQMAFDCFERIDLSEKELDKKNAFYVDRKNYLLSNVPNLFIPQLEPEVLSKLYDVPLKYRYFRYLQRCMIGLNDRKLLSVGYTVFNLKKRLARMTYWKMMWFIDNM